MITVKAAFYKMKKYLAPNYRILDMSESSKAFIFGTSNNDRFGYDIVDKNTGKIDFMWMPNYFDIVDTGDIKEIDISQFESDKVF